MPDDRMQCLDLWQERFGIPAECFDEHELLSSSKTIYMVKRSVYLESFMTRPVQMVGIPFLRQVGRYMKPVTCAVQRFGHMATRNIVTLSSGELHELCREGEISVGQAFTPGFVVVRTVSAVWGAALFLEPDRLLCRFPKNMRNALAEEPPVTGFSGKVNGG